MITVHRCLVDKGPKVICIYRPACVPCMYKVHVQLLAIATRPNPIHKP